MVPSAKSSGIMTTSSIGNWDIGHAAPWHASRHTAWSTVFGGCGKRLLVVHARAMPNQRPEGAACGVWADKSADSTPATASVAAVTARRFLYRVMGYSSRRPKPD